MQSSEFEAGGESSDEEISKLTRDGGMKSFFHDIEDTDRSRGVNDSAEQEVKSSFYNHAVKGDIEGMKILLEENFDHYESIINFRNGDENGYTPLIIASEKNIPSVVKYLTAKGCNLNSQDVDEQTALMKACERGNSGIAKLLLEQKAHINTRDRMGRTALILAAAQGETAVCRLFTRSTNVYVRNHAGKTVMIKAQPEIIELSKAANIDIQEYVLFPRLSQIKR